MIVAFMRTGFETQIRDFNWPQVENGPIKAGGAPPAVIDLLKGRSWPLRNQIATPACTAYAAMACVELSEATNEQEIKRVSVGGAYYHMKQEAAEDVTQPVRADSPGYTRFKDAVGFLTKIGYYDADKWDDRLTEAPSAELRGKKFPSATILIRLRRRISRFLQRPSDLQRVLRVPSIKNSLKGAL